MKIQALSHKVRWSLVVHKTFVELHILLNDSSNFNNVYKTLSKNPNWFNPSLIQKDVIYTFFKA